MTQRFLKWMDRARASMGTKTYNVVFALFAVFCTALLASWGPVQLVAILALFAAAMNNVALYLLIVFSLQYFQGGTKLDLQKKIFEEGNVAAAIYQGLIYLGIAILIGGAIM